MENVFSRIITTSDVIATSQFQDQNDAEDNAKKKRKRNEKKNAFVLVSHRERHY